MPVYQELLDLDHCFKTLKKPPFILNDLVNNTTEDRDFIRNLISQNYSSDMVNILPSCQCGDTVGEYSRDNVLCPKCNTVVKPAIAEDLESLVWFRKPIGVEKLINPSIWLMLNNRFKKSGFSILCWLTDTSYRPTVKQPAFVSKVVEAGIQRGYNNFVRNFDLIIEFLYSLKEFKLKKDKTDDLKRLLEENRSIIFTDFIPLPNKSLLIVERTNLAVYVDKVVIEAIDAIEMLVGLDKGFYDQNIRTKENRTSKALSKLSEFAENYYRTSLAPKSGQFRRHALGSRTNYSFRAVISSLTDTHRYDEIHVPWGIALTAFRQHILNKLKKRGFDKNAAVGLLLTHISKYNPLLNEILEELLREAPNQRITCLLNRNPSLKQQSILRVGITKFKTNPFDLTISTSTLICKLLNSDFDGDECNVSIALSTDMAESWYPMEAKFSILSAIEPNKISSILSQTKPNISTISNWLEII